MASRKKELCADLLKVLRTYADKDDAGDYEYINPYLLNDIINAIEEHSGLEDAVVSNWASDMWSA